MKISVHVDTADGLFIRAKRVKKDYEVPDGYLPVSWSLNMNRKKVMISTRFEAKDREAIQWKHELEVRPSHVEYIEVCDTATGCCMFHAAF